MTMKSPKSRSDWPVYDIPPETVSTYHTIKRAGIAKEDYEVSFGKLHFRTEELKQQFLKTLKGEADGAPD